MKLKVSLINLFPWKNGNDEDNTNYKEALNAAMTEIRKSKRSYDQKFACNVKNCSKSFYAYVRSEQNV